MGDINQLLYLTKLVPAVPGPILEVAPRDHNNDFDFREHYPDNEYVRVGTDSAQNIGLVEDSTDAVGSLRGSYFALAICCSVLEHIRTPWTFAQQLTGAVRSQGTLFISVPWVWGYHPSPDDYFRYSWRAVVELFPDFRWDNIFYSTNVEDEFYPAEREFDDNMAQFADTPKGKRKYLPYLQLLMLGQKR